MFQASYVVRLISFSDHHLATFPSPGEPILTKFLNQIYFVFGVFLHLIVLQASCALRLISVSDQHLATFQVLLTVTCDSQIKL